MFQPSKVQRSGLFEAAEGNVQICIHKEENLGHVEKVYPADHLLNYDLRQ